MPRIPPSLVIRSHDPARLQRLAVLLFIGWLASLVLIAGLAVELADRYRTKHGDARSVEQARDLEAAKSRIAVLERSEQVAKAAVDDLQATVLT